MRRRVLLGGALALPLAACTREAERDIPARWIGADHERGHRLRTAMPTAGDATERRAAVLIVGGGIAGLAAARALMRSGIDDIALLELEDEAGGNSRGHVMAGIGCPRGAHYLPLPGPHAEGVARLLDELGLRRHDAGRVAYDERHLCHAPQERLWIDGAWHDSVLPPLDALPAAQRDTTREQYRRFAALVARAGAGNAFRIPTALAPWNETMAALDAITFGRWLTERDLTAPALRWYLDYSCRDDFGAGVDAVSAWAGLHYFASRHGFHAPGEERDAAEAVLTWPEGNAWLVRRLAMPLGERLRAGRIVHRIEEQRGAVTVDAWNVAEARAERWTASQVIVAVPLFVAARIVESPSAALREAAAVQRHAPWLVANLHLRRPLTERNGAPAAWDNVLYGSPSLGYVDAMHQSLRPLPGPTVLTVYEAPGDRAALLGLTAGQAAQGVLRTFAGVHPDLRDAVTAVDLVRYGHAMSIPAPGVRGHPALAALAASRGRLHFAHADLSGYSIFEEALFHGERAAAAVRAWSAAHHGADITPRSAASQSRTAEGRAAAGGARPIVAYDTAFGTSPSRPTAAPFM